MEFTSRKNPPNDCFEAWAAHLPHPAQTKSEQAIYFDRVTGVHVDLRKSCIQCSDRDGSSRGPLFIKISPGFIFFLVKNQRALWCNKLCLLARYFNIFCLESVTPDVVSTKLYPRTKYTDLICLWLHQSCSRLSNKVCLCRLITFLGPVCRD